VDGDIPFHEIEMCFDASPDIYENIVPVVENKFLACVFDCPK
jgi:hypothetical protein